MSASGGDAPVPIVLNTIVNGEHVVERLQSLSSEDIYFNDLATDAGSAGAESVIVSPSSTKSTPAGALGGLGGRFALPSLKSLNVFGRGAATTGDSRQRQKEIKEDNMGALIGRWNNNIIPQWEKLRSTRRVKDLVYEGIPPAVRETIWVRAVGNDLNITKDYYEILLRRAKAKVAEAAARGSVEDGVGREGTVSLIPLDLARTFPMLDFFKPGGPYHGRLREVLEAYTCYRPDIGYVQGMSYVAAMFLLNVTHDHEAFMGFANALHRPLLLAFYRMDELTRELLLPQLHGYLAAFDHVLKYYVSDVHGHFASLGITPDMYLVDWALTVFAKAAPMDVAARVWDVFLIYGDYIIFRAALGVLKLHRATLLAADFEQVVPFLTRLPGDMDCDALMRAIRSVELTQVKYDSAVAKFIPTSPGPLS